MVSDLPDNGGASSMPPPPKAVQFVETSGSTPVESEVQEFARELFGPEIAEADTVPWNELISQRWLDITRKGLPAERRDQLLKRYVPSETLSFLQSPKLNSEIKSALKSNSIIKRDEFCAKDQGQAGIALCAFGEALSDLLKPQVQQSLSPEIRLAIAKASDGAKILADLFYRLSLSRRAQILPALNLVAKNVAEACPADHLLFGATFGEEFKKATAMEKSAKDIARSSLTIAGNVQQPIKQPVRRAPAKAGNYRAPAPKTRPTTRTGRSSSSRRSTYRPRSSSRRR
ncbi:uncharacterized protein [Temnothorax longispinosus]|uniref:uncharacterized protein n=1 Tax=Temnothorax longispinosus TaxID=300112 RepID=UPI003A9A0387